MSDDAETVWSAPGGDTDNCRGMTSPASTNTRPARQAQGDSNVGWLGDAIFDNDSEAIDSLLKNPPTKSSKRQRHSSHENLHGGASGGNRGKNSGGTDGSDDDSSSTDDEVNDVTKSKSRCHKPHNHVVVMSGGPVEPATSSFNTYAAKKSVAQGMMDIALITANANQLRYLLEYGQDSSTFYLTLSLIIFSLVAQVVVGLALIFKSRFKDTEEKRILNSIVVIGVFLVTIINVFVSSFSFASGDLNASFFTDARPMCFSDPTKPCRPQCLTLDQRMPYNLTLHVCAWTPDTAGSLNSA